MYISDVCGEDSFLRAQERLLSFPAGEQVLSKIKPILSNMTEPQLEALALKSQGYIREYSDDAFYKAIFEYIYAYAFQDDEDTTLQEVQLGDNILVHYTGSLDNGLVFDSSYDHGETLFFTVGAGQMIPGFDAAVVGMKVGDTKIVRLSPSEAYGDYDIGNFRGYPKEDFSAFVDAGFELEIGTMLPTQFGTFEIIAVDEESIFLNLNHPLAGEYLSFEIEIIEIK